MRNSVLEELTVRFGDGHPGGNLFLQLEWWNRLVNHQVQVGFNRSVRKWTVIYELNQAEQRCGHQ